MNKILVQKQKLSYANFYCDICGKDISTNSGIEHQTIYCVFPKIVIEEKHWHMDCCSERCATLAVLQHT